MRGICSLVILAGLAATLTVGVARAQDDDIRPLLDRLDRLERDVNLLQRQVYRGTGPNGAPVPVGPADGQAAANAEVRLSQIDEQIRDLTGHIEELKFGLDQMKQRLDKMSNDYDMRLRQLEGGAGGAVANSPPPPPQLNDQGAPILRPPPSGKGAGANLSEPASRSGTLGSMPAGQANQGASAPADAASAGTLPSGSPQQQYDYAFGLLRQSNYPAAEQALRTFVQRYPKDPLAGNAQYWFGETFFVRGKYDLAAAAFAEGYQKFSKGAKAPDDLLKLGMSLQRLGRKADACQAFARLDRDFSIVPANVREKEAEEKRNAGC